MGHWSNGKTPPWQGGDSAFESLVVHSMDTCPHCRSEISGNSETLSFCGRTATLHQECAQKIWEKNIENPMWFDTFTREHYEKAAHFLRQLDSVGEVITLDGSGFTVGEMFVHTNYCTTSIVNDVIDGFSGRVIGAGVAHRENENNFNCVEEHGTCFEICIDFCTEEPPLPPSYLNSEMAETRDKSVMKAGSKVFDASFDSVSPKSRL